MIPALSIIPPITLTPGYKDPYSIPLEQAGNLTFIITLLESIYYAKPTK